MRERAAEASASPLRIGLLPSNDGIHGILPLGGRAAPDLLQQKTKPPTDIVFRRRQTVLPHPPPAKVSPWLAVNAVRGHWGIENSCHWSLDFTFREDESRIREKQLRANFAWLNRFLLSLLKQHPGKDSIVMRRRGCGWDENFLLQVLTGPQVSCS